MANRWTRVWLARGRPKPAASGENALRPKAYWRYFRKSGAMVIEDGGNRRRIFAGIGDTFGRIAVRAPNPGHGTVVGAPAAFGRSIGAAVGSARSR